LFGMKIMTSFTSLKMSTSFDLGLVNGLATNNNHGCMPYRCYGECLGVLAEHNIVKVN
jgi:hypothetical protein